MKEEASQQEQQMQQLVQDLVESDGFDKTTIEEKAQETSDKALKIMETYLGKELIIKKP
jgi:Spy/CpxP family protein refolding chaperone